MATFPNTPFAAGDDWTPEVAYLAFNQVFDDQPEYLGHHRRLTDSSLSNTAGQIKQRVADIENSFKVSVQAGLTLAYNSGLAQLPDGSQVSIPAGLVVCPDNTTSYIFIDTNGIVVCSITLPVVRKLLARATTVSGSVTGLIDLRHPRIAYVQPMPSSIKLFGGSNASDKSCTNGETLDQGVYYFRNFSIPAGVSITVDKYAKIFCSGSAVIDGTINVTPISAGAAPYAQGVGNGGGSAGSGIGAGSGSSTINTSSSYPYSSQPYGSGGGLGFAVVSTGSCIYGAGGKGGGGLWIEAYGLVTVNGSIFAKGGDGGSTTFASGSSASASGAGAGSGGLVLLSSLQAVNVSSTATIDVRGGVGGAATSTNTATANCMGGSGGGGGLVVLQSPLNNTTGSSILLSGGARGTDLGANPSTLGGGGGGGFGGAGGQQGAGSVGKLIVRPFAPLGS